jgi:hypothetical protein
LPFSLRPKVGGLSRLQIGFLCNSEFWQEFFVRGGSVRLRPFAGVGKSFLVRGCEWLVVNRSIRNRSGRGIEPGAPAFRALCGRLGFQNSITGKPRVDALRHESGSYCQPRW